LRLTVQAIFPASLIGVLSAGNKLLLREFPKQSARGIPDYSRYYTGAVIRRQAPFDEVLIKGE